MTHAGANGHAAVLAITSRTVHEQITLKMMLAPGSRLGIDLATSAVTIEPLTSCPRSSIRNTRSASPSNASPMSAPCCRTAARRSRWFSGSIGSAGWFGNVPSSSAKRWCSSNGSRSKTAGADEPAHAVRGVDRDGERSHARCVQEREHVLDVGGEQIAMLDRTLRAGGRQVLLGERTHLEEPVSSPTGFAPARQNFSPLYCFGLWLAVSMIAGRSRDPEAK